MIKLKLLLLTLLFLPHFAFADLTTSLVSYWNFDVDSSDSVGSNDGTDTDVTYSAGKISSAANFNGSSSKIINSSQSGMVTGAGAFSLNVWFNSSAEISGTNVFRLFNWGDTGTNNSALTSVDKASQKLLFDRYANNTLYGTTVLVKDTWYMATYTYDGTTLEVYLNGTSENSTTVTLTTASGTKLSIGYGELQSGTFGGYFQGQIDEIGYWSRELSSAEVSELYNSGNGLAYPFTGGGASTFFKIPDILFFF